MKFQTFICAVFIVGVSVMSAWIAVLVEGGDIRGDRLISCVALTTIALFFASGVFYIRDIENDDVERKERLRGCAQMIQMDERHKGELTLNAAALAVVSAREIALINQRDVLVTSLAQLVAQIYLTRQPSNESMRQVRRDLVTAIITQLEQGAMVESVTTVLRADALRDVVEAQIKEGKLNIKTGAEWQRELIQHVLSNNASHAA